MRERGEGGEEWDRKREGGRQGGREEGRERRRRGREVLPLSKVDLTCLLTWVEGPAF